MSFKFRHFFGWRQVCGGLWLIAAILPSHVLAQQLPKVLNTVAEDTVYVPTDSLKTPYQLPGTFIIPSSEILHLKDFRLRYKLHYDIDYRSGKVWLLQELPASDSLRIIYRRYPFPLVLDYFHRELQAPPADDSLASANGEITAREVRPKFLDEIDSYQSNLQKSGSIVRGVEIGNNQDLTLNSGLNLQLSGKISPDVELVAALTDESTPIQPEGNTQTLREVDKVFVKIKSPYLGGTLGDFNLQYRQSLFGNLQRKLQGVSVENEVQNTRQQLTYGTSRGFFHSNKFLAQEGNQGPYLLTGRNGEREIIVLAGTERIYVDGALQVRGENNDYIIDYALAQITFTSNKLITSENRIEVDFEYTNNFQRYGRNFLGFSSGSQKIARRFSYDLRLFREWDDTQNLLEDDAPLSTEEEAALAGAGDDPLAAFTTGAIFVGAGEGNYIQSSDSLGTLIYVYVGENQGDYDVRFTGVGAGNGDYTRVRLGEYRYVGEGKGSYRPVRLVPLAGDKRLADLTLGAALSRNWSLKGEFSATSYDQNIFSAIDDGDNQGKAFQLTSTLQDTAFRALGKHLGNLRWDVHWTRQDSSFAPLDRPLQPEYAYKWNLNTLSLTNRENSLESNLSYQPNRYLKLDGNIGSIDKGDLVSSLRRSGQVQTFRMFLPDLLARLEQVESETGFDRSDWQRQNFSASKTLSRFTPRFDFKREDRTVESLREARTTGFRFEDYQAGIAVRNMLGIDWGLKHQLRYDFLYDPRRPGQTRKQAETRTLEVQGELDPERNLKGRFSFAYRDKDFSDFFERLPADSLPLYQPDAQFQDTSWQDRQSHLANFDLQYRNESGTLSARWNYKVASELQALREIRYLKVDETRGNFRYDSTLAEYVPDPQGDYIQLFFQTGNFESVIRLESAVQLQYSPRATAKSEKFWKDLFNRTSTTTYVKVEEQSRENNILDIYLLNLDKFHNAASSLRGVYIINQDINYNERNPIWGLLLRSRYRDNLSNQFLDANNNETRIAWERIVQLRRLFFRRKLNITGEYQNSFNKRWVAASPSRNLNILTEAYVGRFNYRPTIRWQFQVDLERGIQQDRNDTNPLRVNYWDIKPQISFSLRGKARATANLAYLAVEEVDNPAARAIPFEMGKGKKVGDSWQWNARFEYFISSNITINANYNGRRDAAALRTLHLGKAEVRAFF